MRAALQRSPPPTCAAVRRAAAYPNAARSCCAVRSMADAAEAEQQAEALLDAVQQRDVVWIARLARGATSARFAEASCRCLSDILTDGDHVTKPVEAQHVIHALLAALRVHSASAGVQTVACRLLAAMCKESVEARTFAGDGGAVEAAVSSLRGHMENVDVLGAACLALESLARSNRENSCRAHGAGALDALLDVMRAHPRHEDLQQCGCLALGRICENGLGLFVAPDGALAAIINVLRSSPNNSAVQASALGSLAFVIPSAVNADKDPQLSSAVSCIMHALHAHVDAQAHYHACFALTRLAKYQPLKAAEALRLGTFPLLVNTLVLHKMSPIVLVSCISASRSLMFITRSAESTLAVAAVDAQAALSATLAVLRSHPENPDVQDAGCRLVSELALLSSQLAVAAAEAGAYEIMVRALRAFVTSNVDASGAACLSLASLARSLPAHRHRAHAAGAIDAVVTLVRIYPRNAAAQRDAAFALAFLCKDDPDACAHATRCGAVKPLCDAVHTHAGEFQTLKFALEALFHLVSFCTSAAAEVAAAGPAGIGVIAQLLLSSTRKQDREVLVFACGAFTHVTARQAAAAVSSADAVLPLLHVLGVCALEHPLTAAAVCHSLLLVMQSSLACAAEAAARGAAAAVDAAARAYPADAELRRHVAGIRLQLARVDAQSAAARAEAERRAAAMADALIAEEEAAHAVRAAPQAAAARKRPKKKRGGGGNAEGAPADDDAARAPEPVHDAAGAAAALSGLGLDDAAPSAAALRRRR